MKKKSGRDHSGSLVVKLGGAAALLGSVGLLPACSSDPVTPGGSSDVETVGDAGGAAGAGGTANECDVSLTSSAPSVELATVGFEQVHPGGPHPVGTHIAWIEDAARPERNTAEPGDSRGLWLQFFYPSSPSDAPFGPLMDSRVAAVLTETRGYPPQFERMVATHARFDVPLLASEGPLPIVIYSHGQATFPQENQALFEDLASRGWLVVALSHTYSAAATVLPSGQVARSRNPAPPADTAGNESRRAYRLAIDELHDETWVADVRFVMDELERENTKDCSWLAGKLDFERLGLIGYSFGGSTVFDVCTDDARCKAAVGFDGGLWGELERETDKPLMYMRVASHDEPEWNVLRSHHSGSTYGVWLVGADHGNFTQNYPLLEGIVGGATLSRRVDSDATYEVVRDYTLAMLNVHVLGGEDSSLSEPSRYPDVLFERSSQGVVDGDVALLGGVQDSTEKPVLDATITTAWGEATTQALGSFWIDGLPAGETLTLRAQRQGYVPQLLTFEVPQRFQSVRHLTLWTPEELEQTANGVDIAIDAARGHVWLDAYVTEHHKWADGGSGLVASVAGGTVYYGSRGRALDPELSAMGDPDGWAFVPNLEPGEHSLEVELAGATCRLAYGDQSAANQARVLVEPGSVSYVPFRCER